AGVPPGPGAAGRVLGLADAFEAGNAFGLVAVAGAATWLVAAAAAARSVGLPAGRRRQATDALALVAAVLGVIVLAAGPAVAALASITSDTIAGVMTLPTGGLAPDPLTIITVSTRLPAVALFGPTAGAASPRDLPSSPSPPRLSPGPRARRAARSCSWPAACWARRCGSPSGPTVGG